MRERRIVESEITTLRKQLAEKESELNSIKWCPKDKHGAPGYMVTADEKVLQTVLSQDVINFGCGFKTRKRAEHAAHAFKRFHLLYKLAEELNETEHGAAFQHWTISYLGDSKKLIPVMLNSTVGGALPMIYFKTKTLAMKAINIIQNEGLE
jgi:hypothetical protein